MIYTEAYEIEIKLSGTLLIICLEENAGVNAIEIVRKFFLRLSTDLISRFIIE
jgi:hypothetical protein